MAAIVKPIEVLRSLFAKNVDSEKAEDLATAVVCELSAAGWGFEHRSEPGKVRTYRIVPKAPHTGEPS